MSSEKKPLNQYQQFVKDFALLNKDTGLDRKTLLKEAAKMWNEMKESGEVQISQKVAHKRVGSGLTQVAQPEPEVSTVRAKVYTSQNNAPVTKALVTVPKGKIHKGGDVPVIGGCLRCGFVQDLSKMA